jgi:hypothetical protein
MTMRAGLTYGGLAFVFLLSVWMMSANLLGELGKAAFTTSGVAALLGAVFQIVRDNAAFERELEMKREDRAFVLSPAAHMAQIAFDRYIVFCEEYLKTLWEILPQLVSEGPSVKVLDMSRRLMKLRENHGLWVPPDVVKKVAPFENALWTIGAKSISKDLVTSEAMFALFQEVLDLTKAPDGTSSELVYHRVLTELQARLGIAELTVLRIAALKEATRTVSRG